MVNKVRVFWRKNLLFFWQNHLFFGVQRLRFVYLDPMIQMGHRCSDLAGHHRKIDFFVKFFYLQIPSSTNYYKPREFLSFQQFCSSRPKKKKMYIDASRFFFIPLLVFVFGFFLHSIS